MVLKTLQVKFTTEEFKKLQKAKKKSSCSNWSVFLLKLTKGVSCKKEWGK